MVNDDTHSNGELKMIEKYIGDNGCVFPKIRAEASVGNGNDWMLIGECINQAMEMNSGKYIAGIVFNDRSFDVIGDEIPDF
ncbi:MAG: hypothetical protein IPJ26_01360 [Bacteroidetes bacterium]|nr:hypothetical protein [Bacteroidota bacterium]